MKRWIFNEWYKIEIQCKKIPITFSILIASHDINQVNEVIQIFVILAEVLHGINLVLDERLLYVSMKFLL